MRKPLNLSLKIFAFLTTALVFGGAALASPLKAVCSLFPVYDFARAVAGEDAEVRLLLPPGVEAHGFAPRPSDIRTLSGADLFIYTNPLMEPWAERLAETLQGPLIVNASEGITLLSGEEREHHHGHGADPHVWLDLENAQRMVRNIAAAFERRDPEHAELYRKNAAAYCAKLAELDGGVRAVAEGNQKGENRPLVFVGRFAYRYFLNRYGLDWVTAYEGETEPSPRRVAEVIRVIETRGVKSALRDELPPSAVTREIAAQTGAELRLFHTAHTVTREELDGGTTFLKIMQANRDAVAAALEGR